MPKKAIPTMKTKVIEVSMRFYKTFHIAVPEDITEDDVLNSELVLDEAAENGDISIEHEFTEATESHKTPEELASLKRLEKVLAWDDCN